MLEYKHMINKNYFPDNMMMDVLKKYKILFHLTDQRINSRNQNTKVYPGKIS